MGCTVGVPQREGAVGATCTLMNLTVSAEVAAVDVAIERGADLRAVECRVEGRLQAIGSIR